VTIGVKALESSITTPQDAQQMIETNYTLYAG
jgi:hypothetical protein